MIQGKRCRKCDGTERYESNGQCVICARRRAAEWYRANAARRCAQVRARYHANVKRERAKSAAWRLANPDRTREHSKTWRHANADRYAAQGGKDRVTREYGLDRVPNNFDFEATIPFYAKARQLTQETGIKHEVDHILALCLGGMHEASNLQVVTKTANLTKHSSERQTLNSV